MRLAVRYVDWLVSLLLLVDLNDQGSTALISSLKSEILESCLDFQWDIDGVRLPQQMNIKRSRYENRALP